MKKIHNISFAIALLLSTPVFGQWTNWLPTFAGFTSNVPTYTCARYEMIASNDCHVNFTMTGQPSNAALFYVTLPFASAQSMSFTNGTVTDVGAAQANPIRVDLTAGSNIAMIYKALTGIGFTASGNKACKFNFSYEILPFIKNVIFQGNSLMNLGAGNLISNGHYLSKKIYDLLIVSKPGICAQFLAINGNPTTTMNANFNTATAPYIDSADFVLQWEITNDLSVNGLTGAQCYTQDSIYCTKVHALNAKVAIVSFIARDHTGDAVDLMSRGGDCNVKLRANPLGDLFIDLGNDSVFDTRADASNTTYYQTEKLHLTQTGSDYAAGIIAPLIISSGILN